MRLSDTEYENAEINHKISIYFPDEPTMSYNECDFIWLVKAGNRYALCSMKRKFIFKSEFEELLKMTINDGQGNLSIVWNGRYDQFWHKFYNFRKSEIIEKIGGLLWGEHWETKMEKVLGVDSDTIQHWLQCTREIPNEKWEALKSVVLKADVQEAKDYFKLTKKQLSDKESRRLGLI